MSHVSGMQMLNDFADTLQSCLYQSNSGGGRLPGGGTSPGGGVIVLLSECTYWHTGT